MSAEIIDFEERRRAAAEARDADRVELTEYGFPLVCLVLFAGIAAALVRFRRDEGPLP